MAKFRVFVYGTLKRGQPNYYMLQEPIEGHAEFLQEARTCEKFPLVIATRRNIPFLLQAPGRGLQVHGDIFLVDEPVLKNLDILEGVPDQYIRRTVQLESLGGVLIDETTFVYVVPEKNYSPHLLTYPFLESYEWNGSHGRTYIRASHDDENLDDDPDVLVKWRRRKTQRPN